MGFLSKYSSQILGITRIVTGLCFLEHGTTKLLNFPPSAMHPALTSLAGAGGVGGKDSCEAHGSSPVWPGRRSAWSLV